MGRNRKQYAEQEEIEIPFGMEIEDFLDTDDSDFDEPPLMTKEVNIRYGQQDNRTRTDDG